MKKMIVASVFASFLFLGFQPVFAADGGERESGATVEFIPSSKPTPPVDPENPDPSNPSQPINPIDPEEKPPEGGSGPLSIDFVSVLFFGKNVITNQNMVYYPNAQTYGDRSETPNFVQVTDNRGNNTGWTLEVKQNGQFSNTSTKNKELTGAQLKFVQGIPASIQTETPQPTTYSIELSPNGAASLVMSAKKDVGAGTWVSTFGEITPVEEDGKTIYKNKGITLSVPGATPKDAVQYHTSLTWTLTNTPNE